MIKSYEIKQHDINKIHVDVGKETVFDSAKMNLVQCLSLGYVANLGNIIPLC
jgi:hypothetical protein